MQLHWVAIRGYFSTPSPLKKNNKNKIKNKKYWISFVRLVVAHLHTEATPNPVLLHILLLYPIKLQISPAAAGADVQLQENFQEVGGKFLIVSDVKKMKRLSLWR